MNRTQANVLKSLIRKHIPGVGLTQILPRKNGTYEICFYDPFQPAGAIVSIENIFDYSHYSQRIAGKPILTDYSNEHD